MFRDWFPPQRTRSITPRFFVYADGNTNFPLVGGGQVNAPDTELADLLAALEEGGTLELENKVYTVTTTNDTPLYLGVTGGASTIKAAAGARPVITNDDGTPPRLVLRDNTTVQGLWFGGAKDPTNKPVTVGGGCVIEDCTFFGYYECLEQGGPMVRYSRNRFVNCGTDELYHDMYITTEDLDTSPTIVEDQIHIGGEGYKLHMYHGPTNITVRRNFYGAGASLLALDGQGITIDDCIFWSNTVQPPLHFGPGPDDGDSVYLATHNIVGEGCGYFQQIQNPPDKVMDGTVFIGTVSAPALSRGSNPVYWAVVDVAGHLGQTKAAIDAAVAALEASFLESVTDIRADATIEPAFALLADVVATWAN